MSRFTLSLYLACFMSVSILSGIGIAEPVPVAVWLFDDGSAKDLSQNANDGVLKGPITDTGRIGPFCLEFDGTDDFVEVSDSESLSITGDLTLAAWIFSRDVESYRTFISKGNAQSEKINYGAQVINNSHIRFFAYDGTQYHFVDSESVLSPDEWVHIAVTLNSAQDQVKFYFNGNLDATREFAYDLQPSALPLWIGKHIHLTLGDSQF